MTEAEARENIAAMMVETQPAARNKLIRLALGPLGNLSDEAKSVYLEALETA
jgi:hypothetical protein